MTDIQSFYLFGFGIACVAVIAVVTLVYLESKL